jgi:CRISPR-associated endonuclease/helicase Cas3
MTRLNKWPDWLEHIWAKGCINDTQDGESLVTHTWETLSRLRDLAGLRPWLPQLCGFSNLWNVLFWAAFFHDWGKAAQGFQAMLRGEGTWRHRHEVLSLIFLDWILADFSEDEAAALLISIVSHHKDAKEIFDKYPGGLAAEDDPIEDLVNELDEQDIRALWRWLNESTQQWIKALAFDELGVSFPEHVIPWEQAVDKIKQNGAEFIRKQLRFYRRFMKELDNNDTRWVIPGIILRGCLLEVDHISSAHTGKLPKLDITPKNILCSVNKEVGDLYQHQRDSLETVGSAILIAPTGSGKTEAALFWGARQVEDKIVPRLFYTLPYQASMNAMYDRLNDIFPGQVGLLHSRSLLALYQRLMDQNYEAVEEALRYRNLAQLYYYPIQVFSPYQMLKAAFQLKGYEAMLVSFSGSAFIFDEIHAYHPERLALILELTSFLKNNLEARFFIMSATMPSVIQARLEEALGQPQIIRATDSLFQDFVRHEVHLLEGDLLGENNLGKIKACFEQGQSVLVTCNTVTRAKQAYQWLQNNLPAESIILVHSRFNSRDRLNKEQQIMTSTGLKSVKRRPVVVVSTQIVEVSLNIDLDILFSDPAPLEALVQRFGRINRSRRLKVAQVYIFTEPTDGQGIYPSALVNETLKILIQYADGRVLDEREVQKWLDEIYTGSILEEWEKRYQKVARDFRAAFIDNLRPLATDDALAEQFDKLFDGMEVLPLCLENEYKELCHTNSLEASQLLVPISWAQWSRIRSNKLVCSKPGSWPHVVDVSYSPESGLDYPTN